MAKIRLIIRKYKADGRPGDNDMHILHKKEHPLRIINRTLSSADWTDGKRVDIEICELPA